MIIDCHTHLGHNHHITAGAEALIRSMDDAKIDKSLVFAGRLNDCDNKWMMEQINPFKGRLYGVASVHLPSITAQYGCVGLSNDDMSLSGMLDTLNQGAVALKLYTGYEHFSPNSERVRHVLDIVKKYDKPVIFHMGDCLSSVHKAKLKHAQPIDVDDVAVDYPEIKFVIAHLAYPWHQDAAEVCYKNENVYADISGFVYGNFSVNDVAKFKKVLTEFTDICGPHKLLFGTDFPISNQTSYVEALHDCDLGLTTEHLSNNAERVFNLI